MKNAKFELLGRLQRQYHQNHPWNLSRGGLFIPHSYDETKPDELSWWDDVGLIMNKRRVIVWWRHPRHVYFDAIDTQAWDEAGDGPNDDWLMDGGTKHYKRVGKSRKRVVSYASRKPSEAQVAHYEKLRGIKARLVAEGIDLNVTTSWQRQRLDWADGVSLVAPLEVRNEIELAQVAALARDLMLGRTTLAAAFAGYQYGRSDWLRERKALAAEAERVAHDADSTIHQVGPA